MNTKSTKNVREFVAIAGRDDKGHPTVLKSPGHNGKAYEVTLTRNGCVRAACTQFSGIHEWACQGNSHSVCYHVLAACEVAASDAGLELSWCGLGIQGKRKAERLARIEGKPFCVKSAQSNKWAWGVAKGHKPFSLLAWAEKLENVSWYDAELARKILLHNPENNVASGIALRQLLSKYPEQQANLATLFPQEMLKIGRNLLRGEEEVEL